MIHLLSLPFREMLISILTPLLAYCCLRIDYNGNLFVNFSICGPNKSERITLPTLLLMFLNRHHVYFLLVNIVTFNRFNKYLIL